MKWLSRGLYEALLEFIGRATDGSFALRAALYEFHYTPVGEAFKAAIDAGADVKILYDEPNYGADNEEMIKTVGIGSHCKPRTTGGQKHNKFIVLLKDEVPVAVWTGSTNISDGGIFGHSNVGHIVKDRAVARQYLDYWNALEPDPRTSDLKADNNERTPTPDSPGGPQGITALFSPRDPATLDWYAEVMARAKKIVCFTVAFTLDEAFQPFLQDNNKVLRYILKDKNGATDDLIRRNKDSVSAVGAKFERGELPDFLAEKLTGLNNNMYIHDKFMLIDPLDDHPIVVTGSANFSANSQKNNDENMLIIRDDTRVAEIYFGEFMRIFDHLYARFLAKRARESGEARDPHKGYLRPDNSWTDDFFQEGPKQHRRLYFHGRWTAGG